MKNIMKTIVIAAGVSVAGFAAAGDHGMKQQGMKHHGTNQPSSVRYQSESDLTVQENVKAALYSEKLLNNAIFNVSVLDGRVSITGTLEEQSQSGEVKRIARTVDGVRSVTTFLETPLG